MTFDPETSYRYSDASRRTGVVIHGTEIGLWRRSKATFGGIRVLFVTSRLATMLLTMFLQLAHTAVLGPQYAFDFLIDVVRQVLVPVLQGGRGRPRKLGQAHQMPLNFSDDLLLTLTRSGTPVSFGLHYCSAH
jgi:hypothetical protein